MAVANETAVSSNKANQRAIRAVVIGLRDTKKATTAAIDSTPTDPGQSQAQSNDPFDSLTRDGSVIEPPFDMLTLSMLNEHNSELQQCIEAMETNIEGFGHRYTPRVKFDKDISDLKPEEKTLNGAVEQERIVLENFFAYAAMEDSFTMFRRKLRVDLEQTGNAYFEIIRNAGGKIQGFTHMPSYQMRLGRVESAPALIKMKIHELQIDGSVKIAEVPVWRRFRKYVQSAFIQHRNLSTSGGAFVRWFKQFGDPRVYDSETGAEVKGADLEKMPQEKRANEVMHLKLYSARSPYGLPRYVGNLLSIFGDRASEEINYVTFRNNNIPSMVVMVSNGQLTAGSIERIESFVESQIQGSDNYSKFLLLEGESALEGEDGSQVKMEIKPLVQTQHKDALFQEYSKNNQDKIRRAFRLPPIFVGRSEDYTRATAESSRKLADEQIFAPERDEFDNMMNRIMFPEMGILYHKYRSNTPNTTDNKDLVGILIGAEKTGGLTPRIARAMLEDILGRDLPPFPKDFPADIPFSMTLAEAVKNLANAAEPSQQITATKALLSAVYSEEGMPANDTDITEHLVALNKSLDRKWRAEVAKAHEEAEEAGAKAE